MVENDNRFDKFKKDPRFKSVKNKRGTRVKVWVFYSFLSDPLIASLKQQVTGAIIEKPETSEL